MADGPCELTQFCSSEAVTAAPTKRRTKMVRRESFMYLRERSLLRRLNGGRNTAGHLDIMSLAAAVLEARDRSNGPSCGPPAGRPSQTIAQKDCAGRLAE